MYKIANKHRNSFGGFSVCDKVSCGDPSETTEFAGIVHKGERRVIVVVEAIDSSPAPVGELSL